MTTREAILKLQSDLEKNTTDQNRDLPISESIMLLNSAMRMYCRNIILNERSSDNLDIVNVLLTKKQIKRTKRVGDSQYFKIDEPYIRVESAKGYGSKGECQSELTLIPIKDRNAAAILWNKNLKADWLFETAPYVMSENSVRVDADFSIDKVSVELYREPREVDVEGYEHADGSQSKDVEFEFPSSVVEKIIEIAKINYINNNNINK